MRDAGGPVLLRRRGNDDERHEDGEQPGRQSGRDGLQRGPAGPRHAHAHAARLHVPLDCPATAATAPDEHADDERLGESAAGSASAQEARPEKEERDDTHARGVSILYIYFLGCVGGVVRLPSGNV